MTVGANGNVTVEITLTGLTADEVRAYAPASAFGLTVTATEASQTNSGSTQDVEADLELPRVHRLEPAVPQAPNPFDAGTWIEMTLELNNMGNTRDAVTEAEAEVRSCPQLSVLGLDAVAGTVVEPTDVGGQAPAEVTVRLEASNSHPARTCEVRFIVTSEGDGTSRSITIDVDVNAADPEEVVGDVTDVGTSDPSTLRNRALFPFQRRCFSWRFCSRFCAGQSRRKRRDAHAPAARAKHRPERARRPIVSRAPWENHYVGREYRRDGATVSCGTMRRYHGRRGQQGTQS